MPPIRTNLLRYYEEPDLLATLNQQSSTSTESRWRRVAALLGLLFWLLAAVAMTALVVDRQHSTSPKGERHVRSR